MNIPVAASIAYFFYFYFLSLLIFFKRIKSKNQMLTLMFLICIATFLFYKGNYSDWRTYRRFVEICTCIGCTYFEPLYDILTYIASKTIGFMLIPFFSMFLIFSFFIKLKEIVKDNNTYFLLKLSIFFAYLPLYYGALRQSIAFSFLLFSFLYLQKRKYVSSFLLFLVAVGFHLSSLPIFFLVIIYFSLWKFSNKRIYKFILLILLSFIIGIFLLNSLSSYLKLIDSFNPGFQNATPNSIKLFLLPIERIVIFLFAIYVLYYNKTSIILEKLSIISIIGAVFYLIMYKFSLNTAGRIVAFFRLADVFIIYYFFKTLLLKRKTINCDRLNNIAIILVIIYSVIKYYFTIVSVGFFR